MLRPLSDDEKAENWRACRRYLRRYLVGLVLPALLLIWAAGYGQGIIKGAAYCLRNQGVDQ